MKNEQNQTILAGKVPAGYKQTEVGIIPEDWEVKSLSDIAKVKGGKRLPKGRVLSKDVTNTPYIRVADMVMGGINTEDIHYVPNDVVDLIKNYKIYEKEIFISVAGTLGLVGVIPKELDGANLTENADRICQITINNKYLSYYLRSEKIQNDIVSQTTIGAQPKLAINKIENFLVPYPKSLKEQTAIAEALSDVDSLLVSLEKLIEKKRAIKTGTMQQLLTGKKRLPAFAQREDGTLKGYKTTELGEIPEDWEVVKLGDIVETYIPRKSIPTNQSVSFVGMQDVSEDAKLLHQELVTFQNINKGLTYFEKGDVLVAKITPCFENGKGARTQNLKSQIGFGSTEFHILRANVHSISDYVYYWSIDKSLRFKLEQEMIGSAGHKRVPLQSLLSYQIPLPPKAEQTAIAEILSDMDAEIEALEAKRAKTEEIKQGMMQELLTGRTRLI